MEKVSVSLAHSTFELENGRLAKQADGAVWVRFGDTVVLVTVVGAKEPQTGKDFFPLTVEYRERTAAAGKIPGGWFKREGKPRTKETLTSRLIDRPVRPLFPEGYFDEVQIMATVYSADQDNDPDVLAVTGASAALAVSDIPFPKLFGCVRIGRWQGKLVVNPTHKQREEGTLDLVVAASRDAVIMVEGGAKEENETVVLEAIRLAHREIQKLIDLQEELQKKCGKPKRERKLVTPDPEMQQEVSQAARALLAEALQEKDKLKRQEKVSSVMQDAVVKLSEKFPGKEKELSDLLHRLESDLVREAVLERGERQDGRRLDEFRPISAQVSLLPRTHGSALFTRGQTQALVVTTLGTTEDQQILEELEGEKVKPFMLHYNFPPFSVGEIKPLRGPGRREIGHGALAERALTPLVPPKEEFPYTIQVVSDILESNGSSSMATVCGASLSLMDAGVPLKRACAGVAMGLVARPDLSKYVILTDIQGLEDHFGDMDFKVAGTRVGVTAIQMDIKIAGLSFEILEKALAQAKKGRLEILDIMDSVLSAPRSSLSPYAPRIESLKIPVERIRDVIGKGGATVRKISGDFKVEIDVQDDGTIHIAASDLDALQKAKEYITALTQEAEVGKVYLGKVKKITDFGAFVEILPGTDGLVHISELDRQRVRRVEDILKEGEEVLVKCIEIDPKTKKIRLSRKEALGMNAEEYRAKSPLS